MKTNYPTKKLGEVCEIEYGTRVVKSRNEPGHYYVYGGGGKTFTTTTHNRENRVIVSRFGMSPNCVRRVHGKFFLNDSGLTLSPHGDKELTPDYLDFFLFSSEQKIYNLGRGQAQRNLNTDDFKKLEIPIPSLSEQKKIVAKLESMLGKISEAKKLRAEAQEAAQNLLPAELHKIFEEGRRSGWEEKEINDICEHPQYGFTASSTREQVGPKFLRITDIQESKVNWETVPYCRCSNVNKYKLAKGDIVFARTGATVGKSYLINEVPVGAIYASYLIRLRAKNMVIPELLYYFFQSYNYWQQITHEQVGMAQPNVNGSKLAKIKIQLPPLAEQKKIVARLNSLSQKIQAVKELQNTTENEFNLLERSLLQQTFAG